MLASAPHQMAQAARVKTKNFATAISPIPAAIETNDRTKGTKRPKNTSGSPRRTTNTSLPSPCLYRQVSHRLCSGASGPPSSPPTPNQIWGWVGGKRLRFAMAERAIVDVLNNPRLGVSFSQAVSALRLSVQRDSSPVKRLFASVRRLGSDATARRVGYLLDRCIGPDVAAPFLELIGESRTAVPLRRGGITEGPVDPTWRIIVHANTDPEGRDG
jgi:hypothetical protein